MQQPSQSPPRIEVNDDGAAWCLHWAQTRFDIRLHAGALQCDYFGREPPSPPQPLWLGWRDEELRQNARSAGLVEVGSRASTISWRLHKWTSPAPGCLVLTLFAVEEALSCEVTFELDTASGVLRRATVLSNLHGSGGPAIPIDNALSVWITLRDTIDEVIFLSGAWGAEAQPATQSGGHFALALDSRTGKSGFEFQPWVALRGKMGSWVCQLLWSGNWVLHARVRPDMATLSGGLNDWGFHHHLAAGASLMLPDTLLAYVPDEPGAATRRLHDWRRARRPDRHRPLPVQFNTWYACDELPEETRLTALIPTAARLGCEVFVLDAGWYASRKGDPNDDWYMRAGDWIIDRRRLPSGFRRLREMCAQQGMALGIWCEPEAVGPRAQIRQTGASWLHHLDGKPPPPDGRAVLHLGVPEAWEHARRLLFDLIRDSGATWLKWDFNANLGAGGWAPDLPAALTDQDPLVAHYHGLYCLQDALRGAFPDLVLEMCASGAGRMDGAILSHAHTHWLSDQPHAVAKLAIHFGMQQAHPAICCNDWLIDWPARSYHGVPGVDRRGDLMFRLHVAMLGSFGVSAPIDEWAEPDLAIAAGQIALYRNRLRTLIQNGDQYLLTEAPPFDAGGDWAAIWYLEKTGQSGALFTFRLEGTSERHFPLPGFKGGRWRIVGNGGVPVNNGIQVMLSEPYRSTVLVVEQT